MPGKPKNTTLLTAPMPRIKPKANSKMKVFDQKSMKEEQLKKKKKPSKGSTGYSGVAIFSKFLPLSISVFP